MFPQTNKHIVSFYNLFLLSLFFWLEEVDLSTGVKLIFRVEEITIFAVESEVSLILLPVKVELFT